MAKDDCVPPNGMADRSGFDARQGADTIEQRLHELSCADRSGVLGRRQRNPDEQHAIGADTGIDAVENEEGPDRQPCADEQDDRQRNLDNHQHVTAAPPSLSEPVLRPAFNESAMSGRDMRSAGTRPNRMPVSRDKRMEKRGLAD